MTTSEQLTVGVFDDLNRAEKTIDELRRHGFREDEIGIIGHMGHELDAVPTPLGMKAPEWNAVRGIYAGAIFGALIGLMVILAIPGLSQLSGMGYWFEVVGGVVLGSVIGAVFLAFGGLFFSRLIGSFYEAQLEKGRFLVTVKNPRRREEAVQLLQRRAVHSVDERS